MAVAQISFYRISNPIRNFANFSWIMERIPYWKYLMVGVPFFLPAKMIIYLVASKPWRKR